MCYKMKSVAHISTLRHAPSRLQLSVRQPRQGCLPWWPKKYTLATLCFKEAHWQQGATGEYEQTAECVVKDMARLRRLEADLPVKVKYWTKGRPKKTLLQVSLGALLDQLEDSPASEAWLAFTATGQEQQVCWQPADHQDGTGADLPLSDDGLEDKTDQPLGYDDLWDLGGEETPLEENLAPETPAPCVAEDGEAVEGEWATFYNPSTGKTLRLPRHTEKRWRATWTWNSEDDLSLQASDGDEGEWEGDEERWRGTGAWTSEDDMLSPRALRIVKDIQSVVKRRRLPEGPHWWEQASGVTAAAAPRPAEENKQQDTSQLPTHWNLPAFPGCNATPCRPGGPDAGLPEASLPAPHRRGGAGAGLPGMPSSAPRRRGGAARRRTFLVAALASTILAPWIVFHGNNIRNSLSARVEGWVWVWLSGWVRSVGECVGERSLGVSVFTRVFPSLSL